MELVEEILNGDFRAIAKAISMIENDGSEKEELIDRIYPKCGRAVVWGITGPPGAGKSTLVDKLIEQERINGKKIAVIAVDPSSPFSGGAILGDRLRMQEHATDPGVFIRSMASRGHLGGVAGATTDAVKVFDAAGFDLIIIESIGVGQTEIEIIEVSDIVILVLVPGMGDEIQALKAGVMEIGDIYVINKKDHDGADKLEAEVNYMLSLKEGDQTKNPVLLTSAIHNDGIKNLISEIQIYLKNIQESMELQKKRKTRIKQEIKQIFSGKIMYEINKKINTEIMEEWAEAIYNGDISPYSFINKKVQTFLKEQK